MVAGTFCQDFVDIRDGDSAGEKGVKRQILDAF